MLGKFITRKFLYSGVTAIIGAGFSYVTGHHDFSEWTLKGLQFAVGNAVIGSVLSPFIGGSLSQGK